jgi:hypothetical protein
MRAGEPALGYRPFGGNRRQRFESTSIAGITMGRARHHHAADHIVLVAAAVRF